MNKHGQQIIATLMIAIIIFIGAIVFIQPLVLVFSTTLTSLSCSTASTILEQVLCTFLDMGMWYFISLMIAVSLAVVSGKKTITGILTAIFTFIVVTLLISPLKSLINIGRDVDHLNCGSAAISVGQNMICIFLDLWLFYFVMVVIATAITYITVKEVTPQ